METDAIKETTTNPKVFEARQRNPKTNFAEVLSSKEKVAGPLSGNGAPAAPKGASMPAEATGNQTGQVFLGTIAEDTPTVSHLLVGHPQFGQDCWKIIHSEQNHLKPYTKIQTGTSIYMDPGTLEITWDKEALAAAGRTGPEISREPMEQEQGSTTAKTGSPKNHPKALSQHSPNQEAASERQGPLLLGTITESIPTVSHLLIDNPQYGKECWDIIHSEKNRDKPFTQIQPGTTVFLDPESREISWHRDGVGDQLVASIHKPVPIHAAPGVDAFSPKLANAVEPYIGRPYDEIDCYELVVRGLTTLGIRYQGAGGLMERLEEMAAQQGLPRNAYFNGEGLVEASGTKVYARSFVRVGNSDREARKVINELGPLLNKGLIISFSTHTQGHTGIVSRKNGEWTFINSGRMDHDLKSSSDSKLVGEERLSDEIKNWFDLAAESKESLKVTVGRLEEKKLMTFRDDRARLSEQA